MSYEIGKNLKRKKSGKKIFRAEKQLARKYKEEIIVCFGREEEEVKAIKRLSRKEVKDNPHNLDLQILMQYAINNN